ncbi:unnamed protein product [Calicophoron daubneyi]|uniref:Nucleotide exchange factor SIL1 n=1 Tax=Calicophoron daubneyi TaxID=300641 RepID=A0AAV2T609_CALDB
MVSLRPNSLKCSLGVGLILFVVGCLAHESRGRLPEFKPTHEWQTVQPGQPIPPGLHVRQNLQTGKTEAKLWVEGESKPSDAILVQRKEDSSSPESVKEFPQLSQLSPDEQVEVEKIRAKYRPYEELKREFGDINVTVKSDLEILDRLVEQLKRQPLPESELLLILEDLNYLVRQIDNGRNFAETKGLDLLRGYFYHSSPKVQKAALAALGAAIQGNAEVKVIALQGGFLDDLRSLIEYAVDQKEFPTYSLELISSGLATLGSLIRDFPSAQKYFFGDESSNGTYRLPGFDLLTRVFDLSVPGNCTEARLKLRIRIISLLSDIGLERTTARERTLTENDSKAKKLWELYATFPFENELFASGWCDRVFDCLLDHSLTAVDSPKAPINHDRREKVLTAVLNLHPVCRFHRKALPPHVDEHLRNLEEEYLLRSKTREDEFDFYFSDMHHLVSNVRQAIKSSPSDYHHDEF